MIDPRSPDFAATPALRGCRFVYERTAVLTPLIGIVTPFFELDEGLSRGGPDGAGTVLWGLEVGDRQRYHGGPGGPRGDGLRSRHCRCPCGRAARAGPPDCGLLLPRSSEAAESAVYADAISRVLGDPARHRAMGEASRSRIVVQFWFEQMGDRIAGLLTEAVAEGPRTAASASLDTDGARSRAMAHLAAQWDYERRRSSVGEGVSQRMLASVLVMARHRRYLLSARRLWLNGGWRAVLLRVRERLGF